jgi:hypothetical protein
LKNKQDVSETVAGKTREREREREREVYMPAMRRTR